jgi:hypothetical protein
MGEITGYLDMPKLIGTCHQCEMIHKEVKVFLQHRNMSMHINQEKTCPSAVNGNAFIEAYYALSKLLN